MCVPLALACAAGMVVMLFNKGFHIRVGNSDQQIDVKRVVLGFAYPAGAFCISCTVVSVCSSLLLPSPVERWAQNILRTSAST